MFERAISTIVQPPGTPVDGDIVGNLLKFSSTNTAGASVPQRAQADFVVDTPVPTLTKGVQEIVRGGSTVPARAARTSTIGRSWAATRSPTAST